MEDFAEELAPQVDMIMAGGAMEAPFASQNELAAWCRDNQPCFKDEVPGLASKLWKEHCGGGR